MYNIVTAAKFSCPAGGNCPTGLRVQFVFESITHSTNATRRYFWNHFYIFSNFKNISKNKILFDSWQLFLPSRGWGWGGGGPSWEHFRNTLYRFSITSIRCLQSF